MGVIVIGLSPGERGDAATHLGAMVARSTDLPVVVAAITPRPWPFSPVPGDDEYVALMRTKAEEALSRAQAIIGPDLSAQYVVENAGSVSDGLLAIAQRSDTELTVLGSGTSGLPGRVSLGSVGQRILHSLDKPVCFAPLEFTVPAGARLSRITVGFGRADQDSGLLTTALRKAEEFGIPLRVACFAVRPVPFGWGTAEEFAGEELVLGEWAEQVRAGIRYATSQAGADPDSLEIVFGTGASWEKALGSVSWLPTDLLAVGAKTSAVSRFLLGSHAAKIVKNSPVPVLTVSRSSVRT